MFWEVTLSLLAGFWETLKIFLWTLGLSLPLGLIIAFGSMSRIKIIKAVSKCLVWVIRGTPLMLQLIVIFYGPGLIGAWAEDFIRNNVDFLLENLELAKVIIWISKWTGFDRFTAVIVAFVINYSCYFSAVV